MSIKLHKVIHCFDNLIILLYEHQFTIYCDTHRWPDLNVIDVWLYKPLLTKNKFKNKILFNLIFIIILFMTHKNSVIYLPKNIVIGQMFTNVKKKTQKKFDVTYLPKLSSASSTYGMLRPILVIPKKISRKAAIRPIVPIDL